MTSPIFVRVAPCAVWIACIALQSLLAHAGALGLTSVAVAAASGWGYAMRTFLVAGLLALMQEGRVVFGGCTE